MRKVQKGTIEFFDIRKELGVEVVHGSRVGHAFSRHTHRTLCVGLVEEGVRILSCRGTRHRIGAGGIFLIPPDEAHTSECEGEHHSYRLLIVSPELLNSLLPTSENESIATPDLVIEDERLFSQLLDTHKVLTAKEATFFKQAMLTSALGDILEYGAEKQANVNIGSSQYQNIREVQQYIEAHFMDSFSLEDVAQRACLSPFHFLRLFSRVVGVPVHIYQQQIRIRQAKQMLAEGTAPADVAAQTGFFDQSHFSNTFKKLVGITPKDFANSYFTVV